MISLDNVSVVYPVKTPHSLSLQRAIYAGVGGIIGQRKLGQTLSHVQALRGITLEIPDGARLAVLGHNGAGKTTLFRLISGVYPPTAGRIAIEGKISALTDMTLGMEPEESGRKNIIFRLVFMGHDFKTARAALDEIITFSDLGEFIDMPVRTYSTGMHLRLAFAIATHFQPDILILDEIIGAGDEAFQKKALKRIDALLNAARIVLFSSHDMKSVSRYCTRAIVLEQGRIIGDGKVEDMLELYRKNPARLKSAIAQDDQAEADLFSVA